MLEGKTTYNGRFGHEFETTTEQKGEERITLWQIELIAKNGFKTFSVFLCCTSFHVCADNNRTNKRKTLFFIFKLLSVELKTYNEYSREAMVLNKMQHLQLENAFVLFFMILSHPKFRISDENVVVQT